MNGYVTAEVFVSKIGCAPSVVLEFDTEEGETGSTMLNATEATDLMLWLQCALGLSPTQEGQSK